MHALIKQKHDGKEGAANNNADNTGLSPLGYVITQNANSGNSVMELIVLLLKFKVTSLIRNSAPTGPCSRIMPMTR